MTNWSDHEEAEMLRMLESGQTRRQIAAHFGVTRNAICGKVHRLQKSGKRPVAAESEDDECEVDLSRAPILQELLGVTKGEPLKQTRPRLYTEPHKRWSDERRLAASARMAERIADRRKEECDRVFDPDAVFSDAEKAVLARLSTANDINAEDIAKAGWPVIEEMACWFSLLRLEKEGFIFRDARHENSMGRWSWRLTGCGRLFIAPQRA
jgi:transposase-like protein